MVLRPSTNFTFNCSALSFSNASEPRRSDKYVCGATNKFLTLNKGKYGLLKFED